METNISKLNSFQPRASQLSEARLLVQVVVQCISLKYDFLLAEEPIKYACHTLSPLPNLTLSQPVRMIKIVQMILHFSGFHKKISKCPGTWMKQLQIDQELQHNV